MALPTTPSPQNFCCAKQQVNEKPPKGSNDNYTEYFEQPIWQWEQFDQIFHQFSRQIRFLLWKKFPGHTSDEYKEAVQSAWAKVYQTPSMKSCTDPDHLYWYLLKTARHELLKETQRKQRYISCDEIIIAENGEHRLELHLYLLELWELIESQFGASSRLLIELSTIQGYTLRDICQGNLPPPILHSSEYRKLPKSISQLSRQRSQILNFISKHFPPPDPQQPTILITTDGKENTAP